MSSVVNWGQSSTTRLPTVEEQTEQDKFNIAIEHPEHLEEFFGHLHQVIDEESILYPIRLHEINLYYDNLCMKGYCDFVKDNRVWSIYISYEPHNTPLMAWDSKLKVDGQEEKQLEESSDSDELQRLIELKAWYEKGRKESSHAI